MYSRMPCSLRASSHPSPAGYPQGPRSARILVIAVQTGRGLAADSHITRRHSPVSGDFFPPERLGEPPPGGGAGVGWQLVRRAPGHRLDLAPLGGLALGPVVHPVDQHVIAAKHPVIGVDADQLRTTLHPPAGLLLQLPDQRLLGGLARLDTAT